MAFIKNNVNPYNARVGDCVVRAISFAENKSWEEVYLWLCIYGFINCDMPSSNVVWGKYLTDLGYQRKAVENIDTTVKQFCDTHSKGTYLLALNGHLTCCIDGNLYDTWNGEDEILLFYWWK